MKVLVVFLVLAVLIGGCVHYQNTMPVGDRKYMVETHMDWELGINEKNRFKIMDKLANDQCPGYRLINKRQRYDWSSGNWVLQWLIECPE